MNIEPINWSVIDELDGRLDGKVDNALIPSLKAVVAVESSGNGFLPTGEAKKLVEGHRAWKTCLKRGLNPAEIAARGYEDVLYPRWTKEHYIGGVGEESRLLRLTEAVGEEIALMSTSFGLGQVLGENYAACGYDSVQDYAAAMEESHDKQLEAMLGFIKSNNLWRHLEGDTPNFAAFARGYNGPAYAKNQYDAKMHRAFRQFATAPQEDFKPPTQSRRNIGLSNIAIGESLKQAGDMVAGTATIADPAAALISNSADAATSITSLWDNATALTSMGWLMLAIGCGFVAYSWWDDRRKGKT